MKKWLLIVAIIVVLGGIGYWYVNSNKVVYQEKNTNPHLRGPVGAKVSLIEYSDFQCPACGQAYIMVEAINKVLGDKINFEYRNFPLVSIHPFAFRAAEAAECASDQDKFWDYYDLLFKNQQNLTITDLENYATQVSGLDANTWQACFDSRAKSNKVKTDLKAAEALGYNSTPTFILNGERIEDWTKLPDLISVLVESQVPKNP